MVRRKFECCICGTEQDGFEKEYTVGVDICKKLGYHCFYSESTMSFWDNTRWYIDSHGEFKEV